MLRSVFLVYYFGGICLFSVCFCLLSIYLFCFFKQKTAYEMRVSDWSSDVCSSDLNARDALTIGILTAVLAVAVAVVPTGYALEYYIADAGRSFTLTGTTIAVGIFGGYAAIVAVYLGIAGFSPRREPAPPRSSARQSVV